MRVEIEISCNKNCNILRMCLKECGLNIYLVLSPSLKYISTFNILSWLAFDFRVPKYHKTHGRDILYA